ncbi:MAG: peptide deformylase [Patescibacteria group bacterium]|jgi:peptide deformylase
MVKHAITREPKAILHQVAEEVPIKEITSPRVQRLIEDMSDTLRVSKDGIGIAAPQIGVPLRIFVASEEALQLEAVGKQTPRAPLIRGDSVDISPPDKGDERGFSKELPKWQHFVFINPKILKSSRKKVEDSEGCLSVPGTFGIVPRAEKIRVLAYDEQGKKFERGASGLFARLLQHEIDHLEGHLFLEKAKEMIHITRSHGDKNRLLAPRLTRLAH